LPTLSESPGGFDKQLTWDLNEGLSSRDHGPRGQLTRLQQPALHGEATPIHPVHTGTAILACTVSTRYHRLQLTCSLDLHWDLFGSS
jgi:hypothetical protein